MNKDKIYIEKEDGTAVYGISLENVKKTHEEIRDCIKKQVHFHVHLNHKINAIDQYLQEMEVLERGKIHITTEDAKYMEVLTNLSSLLDRKIMELRNLRDLVDSNHPYQPHED